MFHKLRSRLTYANVMSTIAVFVALGGSAYAAATITGADVVNESLTGDDVQGRGGSSPVNGSLTSAEIGGQAANPSTGTPFIDGTLTQWDIKNSSVATDDLANRAVTPAKVGTIPAARARKTSNQSIPDVTNTTLTFEGESFDTAGLHNPSANNTRLTAPTSGLYQVTAGVAWAGNDTRNRMLGLTVNGGGCCVGTSLVPAAVAGAQTLQTSSDLLKLSAGEFVEAVVRQSSGGNLSAGPGPFVGGTADVFLAMTWVGPG